MAIPTPVTGKPHARRRLVSLRVLLALTFGLLVAVSVGSVLAISIKASFTNTFSLLNRQAGRAVNDLENSLRDEAELVNRAVTGLATLYGGRRLELTETAGLRIALDTILESTPAVEALVMFDANGSSTVARLRQPSGLVVDMPADLLADMGDIQRRTAVVPTDPDARWSGPFRLGPATFNLVAKNLIRNGGSDGQVVALVGQWAINRVVAKLGREGETTVFMLTRDASQVFAHSRLPEQFQGKSGVALVDFPDEILRSLAGAQPVDEISGDAVKAFHVQGNGSRTGHIFLTKEVSMFGAEPFILGAYFSGVELREELRRTLVALAAGVVGLLLAVVAAVFLGKRISSPMSRIAANAAAFSDFRLDDISVLPRSRVREIDDQVVAMNTLGTMMSEFTQYVPRKLVARIISSGVEAKRPVEREITIMFTDIVGFTSISERLSAAETALLLNRHFDALANIVGATGGTVDKFVGDGMMAFWGAPEADHDHAGHAVEAARSIAVAISADNQSRRDLGEPALRLRIGIHTGRALVGHIGGGDRQSYTVVGDVVNIAQRLEQMGRELMAADDDVIVLASDIAAQKAGANSGLEPAGTRVLPGRRRPVQVCILRTDHAGQSNVIPLPHPAQA